MIQLLVTDKNLQVVGDPISDWDALTCTRHVNTPAAGTVKITAYPEVMEQLQSGHRLVVMRDGQVWCAGPMEIPQEWEQGLGGDAGGSDVAPPGEVDVAFTSDLALIGARLTYPDPTKAASDATQPAAYTATSVNAETLIRTLVNLNAGPGALTARQVPGLVLAAAAGVGTTVSATTRFEPLLEACRSAATAGGGLIFDTTQNGSSIAFGVRAPADLTGTARFSQGLNNLRHVKFKLSAPTVTTALVAGSGEGDARTIVEATDAAAEAAWWRVEQLVDQGGVADDSTGELTAAGLEALAGGAAPTELSTITVDTEDLQAGRDFQRGDLVTVVLPTGLEVAELVRSDTLTATAGGGELVTCLIGQPDATTDRAQNQLIRDLMRRLGRLEAR